MITIHITHLLNNNQSFITRKAYEPTMMNTAEDEEKVVEQPGFNYGVKEWLIQ